MKNIFAALLIIMVSAQASAEQVHFINTDSSLSTDLCMAGIDSDKSIQAIADEFGYDRQAAKDTSCNGMNIKYFSAKFNNSEGFNTSIFSLKEINSSIETQTCYAAVTGSGNLEKLKQALRSANENAVQTIHCSNMLLDNFVKRYTTRKFTAQR